MNFSSVSQGNSDVETECLVFRVCKLFVLLLVKERERGGGGGGGGGRERASVCVRWGEGGF